jgi:hypothetical protein
MTRSMDNNGGQNLIYWCGDRGGLASEGEESSPKVSPSDDSTRSIADSRMEMIRAREFLACGGRADVDGYIVKENAAT